MKIPHIFPRIQKVQLHMQLVKHSETGNEKKYTTKHLADNLPNHTSVNEKYKNRGLPGLSIWKQERKEEILALFQKVNKARTWNQFREKTENLQ